MDKQDLLETTLLMLREQGYEAVADVLRLKAPRLTVDDLDRILYAVTGDDARSIVTLVQHI